MKLLKLIRRNLRRRPGRTALTIGGVAGAMLLFTLVESLSAGLDAAFAGGEAARTLIVYRQNRYCPQTSFLPEFYSDRISKLPGVRSVLPVKVFLNNCRASLDLVAFQGAPVDRLFDARTVDVIEGDVERFKREKDSALVGRAFAARKGLAVGDKFRFGGINVNVAGVFGSSEPVEEGVVLTHLEFLQRAGPVNKLGTVTQFEVKIDDAARAKETARAIDDLFKTADSPTDTRPKVAFLEGATRDLREILRFARLLGIAAVVVVLALVGNTTLMAVQERVKEFGVLRTLGFRESHVSAVVLGESVLLASVGGLLGLGAFLLIVGTTHLTIGSEGVAVEFLADPGLCAKGVVTALITGAAAGLIPAWRSGRAEIVRSLRGV